MDVTFALDIDISLHSDTNILQNNILGFCFKHNGEV